MSLPIASRLMIRRMYRYWKKRRWPDRKSAGWLPPTTSKGASGHDFDAKGDLVGHHLDRVVLERRAGQREIEVLTEPHRPAAGSPPAANGIDGDVGDRIRGWLRGTGRGPRLPVLAGSAGTETVSRHPVTTEIAMQSHSCIYPWFSASVVRRRTR